MDELKQILDSLYNSFDFERAVEYDPIKFPKRYSNPLDTEIAGFIASCFSYGSIKCFCGFLENLFKLMGSSPYDFILNFEPKRAIEKMSFKYRFSSVYDVVGFLYTLRVLLRNSPTGSLEHYFKATSKSDNSKNHPVILGISNFVNLALKVDLTPIYRSDTKTHGYLHFFPDPAKGSPCKRINLFLRWMVRNRDIDFGLWKAFKPSQLIIPLDIHIWRVSQKFGLTKRKSQDIKTAIEITYRLRQIEPKDPLKYDFVLCHGDIASAM